MQRPISTAALLASLFLAPPVWAQVPAKPQPGAPGLSVPQSEPPSSGENGATQRGEPAPAPQDGEQGREEAAPPHQGSGCPYRQRPLELIV